MPWTDAVLVTDADLTAWERNMPELAQKMKGPSGASAYDGKRALAKNRLAKVLLQKGITPDAIQDFSQLKDAATFLELELIFRDLSEKPESIASIKAEHYATLFESELELLILKLSDGQEVTPSVTWVPAYRA